MRAYALLCRGERFTKIQRAGVNRLAYYRAVQPHGGKAPYLLRARNTAGRFTAGICYSSCIQWNLPHGYFDRPVNVLITEKYSRRIRQEEKGKRGK